MEFMLFCKIEGKIDLSKPNDHPCRCAVSFGDGFDIAFWMVYILSYNWPIYFSG